MEYMEIEDLRLSVCMERGGRKSLTVSVTPQGELLIKAPLAMSDREIERFLNGKRYWIYKQGIRVRREAASRVQISETEEKAYREQARKQLLARTDHYKQILGVEYGRIRIGDQKTRWGSCSSRKTISYNWRLIRMPEEIQDYVVVHELCHLLHMDHSRAFWNEVAGVLPDYQERRRWLKENGGRFL